MRRLLKPIPLMLSMAVAITAQTPAPSQPAAAGQPPAAQPAPQFEVASIKPSPPLDPQAIIAGKSHIGVSVDGLQVRIGYLSLYDLIMTAFKVKKHQVSGPDWMSKE